LALNHIFVEATFDISSQVVLQEHLSEAGIAVAKPIMKTKALVESLQGYWLAANLHILPAAKPLNF